MKSQQKKKNSFMAFLSSLCSAKPNQERNEAKDKKKAKLKVHKVPRLTFQLDRILVKLSRKNVAEEEFMENQVLTYHLQKYLVGRFKDCDIAVFSGQFSSFLMQKIPYSIQLKSTKQEAFQSQKNYLLQNQNGKIKMTLQAIDAIVFQIYFGESQNSCLKSDQSQKTQQSNWQEEVNEQIDKIEAILKFYQKKVSNFVFICHRNLKLEDIHGLFLVYREKYMFEFEKVKKIQKTVCNIIYVSTKTKFLRIDDLSLCDFVMSEFERMRGFDEEKVRNKTPENLRLEQIKDKHQKKEKKIIEDSIKEPKYQTGQQMFTLKELPKRKSFESLLLKMFEQNLQLNVSQALATILQFSQKKANKINWFLELMHERYPESREIVEMYRSVPDEKKEEEFTKSWSELTPIFAQRSNNFSKMTALFRTHSSKDQDEFIFCKDEDNDQAEF